MEPKAERIAFVVVFASLSGSSLWLLVQGHRFLTLAIHLLLSGAWFESDLSASMPSLEVDPMATRHLPAVAGAAVGVIFACTAAALARRASSTTCLGVVFIAHVAVLVGFAASWTVFGDAAHRTMWSLALPVRSNLSALMATGLGLTMVAVVVGVAAVRRSSLGTTIVALPGAVAAVGALLVLHLHALVGPLSPYDASGTSEAREVALRRVLDAYGASATDAALMALLIVMLIAAVVAVVPAFTSAPRSPLLQPRRLPRPWWGAGRRSFIFPAAALGASSVALLCGVPLAREVAIPRSDSMYRLAAPWRLVLAERTDSPWQDGLDVLHHDCPIIELGPRQTAYEAIVMGGAFAFVEVEEKLVDHAMRRRAVRAETSSPPACLVAAQGLPALEVVDFIQRLRGRGFPVHLLLVRHTFTERAIFDRLYTTDVGLLPTPTEQDLTDVRAGEEYGAWVARRWARMRDD